MKDPSRPDAARRPRRRDALQTVPAVPGSARVRTPAVGDPADLVGEGIGGELETGFRRIHSELAMNTCSACRHDPVMTDLNYRLVLRCASAGEDL